MLYHSMISMKTYAAKVVNIMNDRIIEFQRWINAIDLLAGTTSSAYRFSGEIYPITDNSIGWSAGTLEVNDESYEVSEGTIENLSYDTTYYLYFDTKGAGTFEVTTGMFEAQSGDNIRIAQVVVSSGKYPTMTYYSKVG